MASARRSICTEYVSRQAGSLIVVIRHSSEIGAGAAGVPRLSLAGFVITPTRFGSLLTTVGSSFCAGPLSKKRKVEESCLAQAGGYASGSAWRTSPRLNDLM